MTGKAERMTGARAFVECLYRENVEIIFGYPGGVLLPIYDELYDAHLHHLLVRHEQAAVHAAEGYARATGKVGVCLATSGPGATNLVTGIANAYMDSIPMVAFTGQVPSSMLGNDAFQEADITGITMPITKHNYLVQDVKDLPRIIKEAFHIASTGRPGPVLVDIPKDITTDELDFVYPDTVELRGYKPTFKGNAQQVKRAASVIKGAKRPVIYAGGGVIGSEASKELLAFAEKLKAPVTTTLTGIGGFPNDNELYLGMPGMHGTKYANYAIQESDVLIAVGVRFDDRVTGKTTSFAPNAKVIHIDIDPAEISKIIKVDVPIVGDAKQILGALLEHVSECDTKDWLNKIATWKRDFPLFYVNRNDVIKPQYILEQISEVCPDAIIVTEVGQHQMWAAQYFNYKEPRTFISSGGLGTMGYGFPAAIGAKLGRPDKIVVDVSGDGSFQMNSQEMATIVQNNIPIIIAIFNNGYLGMVRQWQALFFEHRYSHTTIENSVDFVKLAEAYGAMGIRVTKPSEVKAAIEKAVEANGPVLIDFVIEREENVSPMVPAGAAINEILDLEDIQ
ncbi:acetolactate synthase large subunit [Methanococcoides alaskense]|uniref:Acetolactate synthase n=1 Tax=Methanococcoides alaskense TaxID=325778 RepID=A0AA90Z955_9EURY|nr:acetolactate synthase large subunit [Methanococcoides alaskense]MDA0524390.1 acetolactate synthase large subunit [Methanococcoides alaskense]MDR6223206.1 acetolactate synthase-1/2/3 large subunit [Methanococcoides alaskense]